MSNLFHFTKLNTVIEKILPTFSLRANDFFLMNDPRETYVWAFSGRNIQDNNNENLMDKQFQIGYDSRKDVKILCFTKEDSGFKNELMWTHYADKHSGICLEIDELEFLNENKSILAEYKYFFDDVEYLNFREVDKPRFNRNLNESYDDALYNFISNHYDWLYFKKSNYWRLEDEKRLVSLFNKFDGILSIKNSLKTIYLGIYTPDKYICSISNLILDKEIKIQQCYLNIQNAEIEIIEREKGDNRKLIFKKYLKDRLQTIKCCTSKNNKLSNLKI